MVSRPGVVVVGQGGWGQTVLGGGDGGRVVVPSAGLGGGTPIIGYLPTNRCGLEKVQVKAIRCNTADDSNSKPPKGSELDYYSPNRGQTK